MADRPAPALLASCSGSCSLRHLFLHLLSSTLCRLLLSLPPAKSSDCSAR